MQLEDVISLFGDGWGELCSSLICGCIGWLYNFCFNLTFFLVFLLFVVRLCVSAPSSRGGFIIVQVILLSASCLLSVARIIYCGQCIRLVKPDELTLVLLPVCFQELFLFFFKLLNKCTSQLELLSFFPLK